MVGTVLVVLLIVAVVASIVLPVVAVLGTVDAVQQPRAAWADAGYRRDRWLCRRWE